MKKFLIAVSVILAVATDASYAIEKCGAAKRITCVVDGDTIWFEGEKIRMRGYDTPEPTTGICGGNIETVLAAKATSRLIELLTLNEFTIERFGKDKYKRTLADIRVDGVNVGDILIGESLAREWPDGKEFWCRNS